MLTTKKQVSGCLLLCIPLLMLFGAGCRQSGSDLVRNGQRLIGEGQYSLAIHELRAATSLMPSNAVAWAYLGLAHHLDGSPESARRAYSTSVSLNPDYAEARFNLGCLYMEQRDWAHAREQLAAATVLQEDFATAWQQLGEAQLRMGDPASALKSLSRAVQLSADDVATWNWLGLAQLSSGRSAEAARSFGEALQRRANHGPALLNLAIVTQTHFKRFADAAELYRRYVAFHPNAPNADEVRALAERLATRAAPPAAKPEVASKPTPSNPDPPAQPPPPSRVVTAPAVSRTPPVQAQPPVVPAPTARTDQPTVAPASETPVETVSVNPAPTVVVQPAPVEPAPVARRSDEPAASTGGAALSMSSMPAQEPAVEEASEKRGFFGRINPARWLRRRPETSITPLPSSTDGRPPAASSANAVQADPTMLKRYDYPLRQAPERGDKRLATVEYEKGQVFLSRGLAPEALQAFGRAVQADPSHFGAQFQLGVLSMESGDLRQTLHAFEAASVIQPESMEARYNFALALKASGYARDAARQLYILLEQDPDNIRAQLTLGNLHAQQFGDETKARQYYLRVLELDPEHPQADSIRRWLGQNPL